MAKTKKIQKRRLFNLIGIIVLVILLVIFVIYIASVITKSTDTFMVEEGSLSFEEEAEGYVIRDEIILKGDDSSSGISQIVTDGTRVSVGEPVFRYYSNNEEEITNQISELDNQIDEALENSQAKLTSVDLISIEAEMKEVLDDLYKTNSIQKMEEYKSRLNSYAVKKAEIAGSLSSEDSYVRELINERQELNDQLTSDSETIVTDIAGLVSYRVDGLEDVLIVNNEDFSYLSNELFDSFDLKVGTTIPESTEAGKIVNNYFCYVACSLQSENAENASVGDDVKLKLSDGTEVESEIVYTKEDGKNTILVFKITRSVENLLEYRKISFEIVWWDYSGWKISNNALIEKDDLTYVKRVKAGVEEEILVKVLRQNSTYSIVTNYSDDELQKLGFTLEEIQDMPKIKLYDKIMVKNE